MDKKLILKKYFGYDEFKYPQDFIIDKIEEGNDVIGLLPTGFGKSVIYQVLAMMQSGITIIISPLIALMEDQVNGLKKKGICVAMLHSNLSFEEQTSIYQGLLKEKYKLLYVSAERLENEIFQKYIMKLSISLLVIDEAHTMLWAENFRKAYGHIYQFIQNLSKRPKILAVTATATNQTIEKISKLLKLVHPLIIELSMDRPLLFYSVIHTKNKMKELTSYLKRHSKEKGILYCLTRRMVEELHKKLWDLSFAVAYYHGGMSLKKKQENQENFTKGISSLMICTNAFGMGIDIPDIRFVIEYELPQSIEDLVQHMGRASRDGKYGEGILFFSYDDLSKLQYFIELSKDRSTYKENQLKIDAVVDYCLSRSCRHKYISNYFQQSITPCKYFCDNCKKSR
ncbi:MAG: RecQ family ATP-dependent DNA helicase [Anaeroplasmataceae bacterium]|nr:RecQ family ATP-dependent DNA helicase [Anaeroplasmataceae bacterium]